MRDVFRNKCISDYTPVQEMQGRAIGYADLAVQLEPSLQGQGCLEVTQSSDGGGGLVRFDLRQGRWQLLRGRQWGV